MPPLQYEPPRPSAGALIKKYVGPVLVVLVFAGKWLGKLKFVGPALLKFFPVLLKTGGTMILAIGGYTLFYGWVFAVGLVLLILVHECGHLVAARMLGLNVGAPVFIPFMGALIALKDAPKNAWVEALVGIGGPLFGSAAAFICYGVYAATGAEIWKGFAYVGFFLNLFNLIPIGFLDGGRIATALSPWLWVLGTTAMIGMLILSPNFMIFLILLMSAPRVFTLFRKRTQEEQRYFEVTPGQRALMAVLYFGLAASLALGLKVIIASGLPGLRS